MDIVCRSLFPELLQRMKYSAEHSAWGPINFYTIQGNMEEVSPKSINDLAKKGKSDIIVFVHDDIVFMSHGWDNRIIETMKEDGRNCLGVVGSTKYTGGLTFSAGREYGRGKYVSDIDGHENYRVKIFSKNTDEKVKVVDGMFIAVTRTHFEKEQFDENLTFFTENDYCLRSICGITDILIGHYKTPDLYGAKVWPIGQDLVKDSTPIFYSKWPDLKENDDSNDNRCAVVDIPTYTDKGQDRCYEEFSKKYLPEVVKC